MKKSYSFYHLKTRFKRTRFFDNNFLLLTPLVIKLIILIIRICNEAKNLNDLGFDRLSLLEKKKNIFNLLDIMFYIFYRKKI